MPENDFDRQAVRRTWVVIAALAVALLVLWLLIASHRDAGPDNSPQSVLPGH